MSTTTATTLYPVNDPVLVGNCFVKSYYPALASCPSKLHRMYKDDSRFMHGNETILGQEKIKEKIMTMYLEGVFVDYKCLNLNCQASLDGGVMVMVSGFMSLKNKPPKAFMQTFFLAVQGKGYYVLNDSFCYLASSSNQVVNVPSSPATAMQMSALSPAAPMSSILKKSPLVEPSSSMVMAKQSTAMISSPKEATGSKSSTTTTPCASKNTMKQPSDKDLSSDSVLSICNIPAGTNESDLRAPPCPFKTSTATKMSALSPAAPMSSILEKSLLVEPSSSMVMAVQSTAMISAPKEATEPKSSTASHLFEEKAGAVPASKSTTTAPASEKQIKKQTKKQPSKDTSSNGKSRRNHRKRNKVSVFTIRDIPNPKENDCAPSSSIIMKSPTMISSPTKAPKSLPAALSPETLQEEDTGTKNWACHLFGAKSGAGRPVALSPVTPQEEDAGTKSWASHLFGAVPAPKKYQRFNGGRNGESRFNKGDNGQRQRQSGGGHDRRSGKNRGGTAGNNATPVSAN